MTADQIISFEKTFEFSLLPEFISKQYPHLSKQKIEQAIETCLLKTKPPREENQFVDCVKRELGVK